jgi:hypothetical protein
MSEITALVSMLHEPVGGSARRLFRGRPVLRWTLDRLSRAQRLDGINVLCWDDQLPDVEAITDDYQIAIHAKSPRTSIPAMQAVSAARRWADGWRGGLLQTCDFDLGFHAAWSLEILQETSAQAVFLVDPSAGLIDPLLIDAIITHARAKPDQEICFSQAAPGLAGAVVRRPLLERLASAQSHPGRVLSYSPDQPMRDPIGTESCFPVATAVARSPHNFRLDSSRQIARLTEAFVALNGQLISSDAEELVRQVSRRTGIDPLPREVVVELNTRRLTQPTFRPSQEVSRPPMSRPIAALLLDQLAVAEDIRITLAGVGDPLESDMIFEFLDMAAQRGLRAIHVETDLLSEDVSRIERLAAAPLDVISFHIPAMCGPTYNAIMGVDLFTRLLRNVSALAQARHAHGGGVPLIVPTFMKCAGNLAEMESWYDQWTRAIGCAVITGPSDFAGQIPDTAVADMSPPRRRPCARIDSRMTVLCDGSVVSCEQDIFARQTLGHIGKESIEQIWAQRFQNLRGCHARGEYDAHPLCEKCREWHRP